MQLLGEISRQGVIHTTLQDMYFIVSIAWIFIQAWKIFEDNKRSEPSAANRRLMIESCQLST